MAYSSRQRATRWVEHDGLWVGLTWARAEGGTTRLVGVEVWTTWPGSDRVNPGPEEPPYEPLGASDRPAAVSAAVLRSLPLASIERRSRAAVLDALTLDDPPALLLASRPTRYPDSHYVTVARLYRSAVENGADPLREILSAYPWASKTAAAKWVSKCRHRLGLIPPVMRSN